MNDVVKFLKETVNLEWSKAALSIYSVIGIVGSAIASAYGGWTESMNTLLIMMCVDYVTGLMVAGVFHASKKSENGGLESKAGWKGLCRKGVTLLIVLIAARFDITLGLTNITAKESVCIGFIAMEAISIVENAGLMGMPLPNAVTNMIDVLRKKADESADKVK